MSSDHEIISQLQYHQLRASPYNVRKNRLANVASPALARSIVSVGLIYPLKVHPMADETGTWGVHCGGRRWRTIGSLIDVGQLPIDWPINVVIRDGMSPGKLREESAGENIPRMDLLPFEVFAFAADAHADGESIEDIAEAVGQDRLWVEKALRLGKLARPIFDALEEGLISVEQAEAYGATEYQELQLSTFEALSRLRDFEKTPAKIRAAMNVGDAEAARLLRFVGLDAYRAAGGWYEADLFNDGQDDRGVVHHGEILRGLVNDALAGFRDDVRARYARPDLRFVTAPPQNGYGGTDHTLEIIRHTADGMDVQPLPEGDVVGHVRINEAGQPAVTFWWSSLRAKHGQRRPERAKASAPSAPPSQGVDTKQSVDARLKDDSGLSAETIQAFRSIRRIIMRAALVDDADASGQVAIDFLVWSQLRMKVGRTFAGALGIGELALPPNGPEAAREHIASAAASRIWGGALHELQQQSFFTSEDLPEAFLDYRASSPRLKAIAAAVVTGWALERSVNADGYGLPVHDALGRELRLNSNAAIRRYWSPTTATLDLLPKANRLEIAEPFVESATFGPWSRLKGSEVTANVLQVVTGRAEGVRSAMTTDAAEWVHPLLQFAPNGADAASAEQIEDASR